MKRFAALLLFLPLLAVAGLAGSSSASAASGHAGTGPWNICSENGNHYCVYTANVNAGTHVFTQTQANARNLTWVYRGTNSDGVDYGLFEFYNGLPLASDSTCNTLIVAATTSDNGVIWYLRFESGHLYITNRYCASYIVGGSKYEWPMGDDNNLLTNWRIVDKSAPNGWYIKMNLLPA